MTALAVWAMVEATSGDLSIASIALSTFRNRLFPGLLVIASRRFYRASLLFPHASYSEEKTQCEWRRPFLLFPFRFTNFVLSPRSLDHVCPAVFLSRSILRPPPEH